MRVELAGARSMGCDHAPLVPDLGDVATAPVERQGAERGADSAGSGRSSSPADRKIGTWMLVGLIYYGVSGGPLGMEIAVRAAGPALALLGFIVMPIVWGGSEAAMTAELCVVYPEAAGFAAWTNAAFGPYASFLCSMLHWTAGVLDNAVYPGLMLSYIVENRNVGALSGSMRQLLIFTFSALMTLVTWRGLDVNGGTCIFLTAFVLLPYVAFSLLGVPQVDPANWFLGPDVRNSADDGQADDGVGGVEGSWGDVNWRVLLNCLFWNVNCFDSSSAFSGDTANPVKTMPRAMVICMVFVVLTYVVPLAVATGADPRARYCDGCLVSISAEVVGDWLGAWVTIAAAVSCIGLFIAEMASDAFQVMGLADQGQLPTALAGRSKHGTPTVAIIASFAGVLAAAQLDFTAIIEMENIIYVFAEVLEIFSLIKLRRDNPNAARAWQIPVESQCGLLLFFAPALVCLSLIVVLSSPLGLATAIATVLLTSAAYVGTTLARAQGWCRFNEIEAGWGADRDPAWVQSVVAFAAGLCACRGSSGGGCSTDGVAGGKAKHVRVQSGDDEGGAGENPMHGGGSG